ncbi:MAG: hypothetical protein SPL13_02645, partial [Clostridia bacterium]|nr:hypothetical protein [Clostridia bacterium]
MENSSIEILKLFTRKLVNCRYKISAVKLAKYLNEGKFGYTFDETGDNIITNDSVFADDVALVVDRIRAIYNEPHISLRKDEIVQNVSVASKFDNRSIEATYKDEKLWRVRLGEVAPEFIHTYVHEDNLAIYENRFVTYLLDYLLDAISKKLRALCGDIQTFNLKIDENGNEIAYPSDAYLRYTEKVEEIPVLATLDDPETNVISSLLRSRSILNSLRTYEIYKACKKVGFNVKNLKPTNILLKDADYNYCYKFFIAYLHDKRFITTQSKMYQGFVLVNTVSAILDAGFTADKDAQDILINDVAELRFDKLVFNKGVFTICVSMRKDGIMVIDVIENPDNSTARYFFKIMSSSLTEEMNGMTVSNYAKYLDDNRADGITRIFLVTDVASNSDNVIYVAPDKLSARKNLQSTIKTITMLVQGVSFIHTKYCPVCGTQLIAPDGRDYVCTNCKTTYHIFHYEFHDYIWLKRLPNIVEKRARTTERFAFERPEPVAVATETVAATEVPEEKQLRRVVTKSFEGKLRQAKKEQIEFYNELKNYLLSFKRVNSRLSWSCDSFNIGREKAVKIGFRGQTMVAYLALNPND